MAGNTSASSLVKTAQSIAGQIADYNDKIQALNWNSSAQTDADFQAYSKYLNSRISSLSSQGTLSSSSKALTLTSTLQSANRSYVSNSIQRATIATLDGTGTTIQKRDLVASYYGQAVANGDNNLAQNLEQQYYSLDIQAQNEAKTAADAADALAKKNATAIKLGYTSQVNALQTMLGNFGKDITNYGQGAVTGQLQNFSTKEVANLKKLGVQIPDGAQLNNGSIIEGVLNAIGESYAQAGSAIEATDPTGAQDLYNKATNIAQGNTTFNVGGQPFTLQDASFYAKNPGAFFVTSNGTDLEGNTQYKLQRTAIDGYQFDQQGNVQPIYAQTDISKIGQMSKADKNKIQSDLEAAGLSVNIDSKGNITAATSDKSTTINNAVKGYGLPQNTKFIVTQTAGGYQFAPVTDAGGNQRLLVLTRDNAGKFGLYTQQYDQTTGQAYTNLIERDKGFNTINNQLSQNGTLNNQMQQTLGNLLTNYQQKGTNYTENTVIPQIAKQYFNGNTAAAADAVYRFRAPLEQGNQPVKISTNAGVNGGVNLGINTVNGNKPNVNTGALTTGLQQAFNGFSLRPTGYTESSIIPSIAKQFFGGNTSQAATAVYNYRKASGLENPQASPASPKVTAPAPTAPTTSAPAVSSNLSIGAGQNNIQSALQSSFANFSTRPSGYTESTILKNIAGQFFGGDTTKAAAVVYPYRKQNFGS